jgi:hypothetical protein
MAKTHIRFIELGDKLRTVLDENYDLTSGCGLPVKGDVVWIYDDPRLKQFTIVERHWHIGNIIGLIEIFVVSTVDQAKTI